MITKITFCKPSVCVVDTSVWGEGSIVFIVVTIYKARESIQQISVTTMSSIMLS